MAPKVILEITKEDAPRVAAPHGATILSLGNGIWQTVFHYGFKEQLDVADAFRSHTKRFPEVDLDLRTSFVEPSIIVKESHHRFRPRWRKSQFSWPASSVEMAFDDSQMLPEQLVQIGSRIELEIASFGITCHGTSAPSRANR